MRYLPGRICCVKETGSPGCPEAADGSTFKKLLQRAVLPLLLLGLLALVTASRSQAPVYAADLEKKAAALLQNDAVTSENSGAAEDGNAGTEETNPVLLEDSELPAPADPGAYTKGKLIFIGDSRTVDIMNAVQDNSIWSCKVGKGYNWMSGTGVPAIEGEIEKNTSVIFLMGVNDPSNLKHYINYINAKANEWAALGAQTYFVSVGPVTGDPYVTNDQIEVFNASMEASLAGVIYIDIYNYLMDTGFSTIDGTHYPDWISINIYNYILEHLEPESDGIWG